MPNPQQSLHQPKAVRVVQTLRQAQQGVQARREQLWLSRKHVLA